MAPTKEQYYIIPHNGQRMNAAAGRILPSTMLPERPVFGSLVRLGEESTWVAVSRARLDLA